VREKIIINASRIAIQAAGSQPVASLINIKPEAITPRINFVLFVITGLDIIPPF